MCCDIDSKTYEILQGSRFGWICPTCNQANYADAFFTDDLLPDVYNPYDRLDDQTNCSKHMDSTATRLDGIGRTNVPDNATSSSDNDCSNPATTGSSSKPKKKQPRRKIRCVLVNCRSVKKKVADLEVLNYDLRPDFLCGTESWLKQAISSSEIFPPTLNVFREDRVTDTVGGGVFQAVKDDLICTHLQDLNTDCEVLWTETQIKGRKPLIVGVFYSNGDIMGQTLTSLTCRYLSWVIKSTPMTLLSLGTSTPRM